MADHNDPNAVNTIFSDIDVSAADLYDLFGFPSDDTEGGEKVVVALTFAAVPRAGVTTRTCCIASRSLLAGALRGTPEAARRWKGC